VHHYTHAYDLNLSRIQMSFLFLLVQDIFWHGVLTSWPACVFPHFVGVWPWAVARVCLGLVLFRADHEYLPQVKVPYHKYFGSNPYLYLSISGPKVAVLSISRNKVPVTTWVSGNRVTGIPGQQEMGPGTHKVPLYFSLFQFGIT